MKTVEPEMYAWFAHIVSHKINPMNNGSTQNNKVNGRKAVSAIYHRCRNIETFEGYDSSNQNYHCAQLRSLIEFSVEMEKNDRAHFHSKS